MKSTWRALPWICILWLIWLPAQAQGKPPQGERVPAGQEGTVVGRIGLKTGETRTITFPTGGPFYRQGTRNAMKGDILSWDPEAQFYPSPPADEIQKGARSITIRAAGPGVGYVMGRRCGTMREDGQTQRFCVICTWILIVNEDSEEVSPTLPDIPRAVITGRAVMRGTGEGVADAMVELQGERSGLKRRDWRTGTDGRFTIRADRMLSVDRYEIFVRKPSRNVGREDAVMEDLWPIHRYLVDLNHDNCLNLNVGDIQMASVEDQERSSGRMDRSEYLVSPAPPTVGAGKPASAIGGSVSAQPGQPSPGAPPPWVLGADTTAIILVDARAVKGATGSGGTVRTAQVSYKGYVEVDFNLKATLSLTFKGARVTGELYAPYVMQSNVRLSGARMQLEGKLTGGWEDGGEIQGDCTGHVLWPGSNPEAREGRFTIRKVGDQIRFQSTKFYYNKYIFEAKGFRYTVPDGDDASATDVPGGPIANSIVILIDASGSMKGTKIANAKATAKRQIAGLGSDTELAVIAFSGNAVKSVFAPMNSAGRERAQAAVDGINADGGTPLAAGIREAGSYMRRNARGQKLTLIVLSDGEETGGGNPPEEVRRLNDMTVTW